MAISYLYVLCECIWMLHQPWVILIFIVFLSSGADRLRGDMKAAATVTVAVAAAAYSWATSYTWVSLDVYSRFLSIFKYQINFLQLSKDLSVVQILLIHS